MGMAALDMGRGPGSAVVVVGGQSNQGWLSPADEARAWGGGDGARRRARARVTF